MGDLVFIGQLVESLNDAISKIDSAIRENNFEEIKKLKIFIFDLYRKIDLELGGKR